MENNRRPSPFDRRSIIFEGNSMKYYDPLSTRTLSLEEKLCRQQVDGRGVITGSDPMPVKKLPTATGKLKHNGVVVLAVAQRGDIAVLGVGKEGKDLDNVIRKL